MAILTPNQKEFLVARQKFLEGKACPVCGSKEEKEILDQHYQLLSNHTPDGVIPNGVQRFTPVGIIKCTKCEFIYPFFMDIE